MEQMGKVRKKSAKILGEAKLICCFTGQATQKVGSVGRQKNKNKAVRFHPRMVKIAAKICNFL